MGFLHNTFQYKSEAEKCIGFEKPNLWQEIFQANTSLSYGRVLNYWRSTSVFYFSHPAQQNFCFKIALQMKADLAMIIDILC